MVTPAAKREAVAHLCSAFDMSERRACRTIGCVRMTVRYCSRRPNDTELRQRLRALAHERRRFGYRRLHVLLRREGFNVNHKRLFRLYREERLMVRRRGGRKRALGTRAPMLLSIARGSRLCPSGSVERKSTFEQPPEPGCTSGGPEQLWTSFP
jgi:putative transposase